MIMLLKFSNFSDELSENDELREFKLSGSDCICKSPEINRAFSHTSEQPGMRSNHMFSAGSLMQYVQYTITLSLFKQMVFGNFLFPNHINSAMLSKIINATQGYVEHDY